VQGQDQIGPKDGEMQVRAVLKEFQTLKQDGGSKKNVGQPRPPARNMKKTLDGSKTYPEALSMRVKVVHVTPVKDECELLEDGSGYRMRATVSYHQDAEKWLAENYGAFYDGLYKGSVPIGMYIDEEGNTIKERWITVEKGAIMKMKVGDNKPKTGENIFRQLNATNTGHLVVPRSCLTFNKCVAEVFVGMQQAKAQPNGPPAAAPAAAAAAGEDAAPVAGGAAAAVQDAGTPVSYTCLHCKGWATLDPNHDPAMPESELMHMNDDKNVHNFVPVAEFRAGAKSMPFNMYLYTRHRYQSPYPRRGPGVTVLRVLNEDMKDFLAVRDDIKTPRYTCRLIVWQWTDTVQMTDKYTVKIIGQRDCWRSFGITNPEVYASIVHAHYTIPCHVEATLWKNSALTSDTNDPQKIAARPDALKFKGDYTYGTDTLVVDYLRYLPEMGIPVSGERVVREFEQWQGTVGRDKRPTLMLRPMQTHDSGAAAAPNPLHTQGLGSPVISLGNDVPYTEPGMTDPVYPNHGFAGDVRPLLEDKTLCEFYALTSHVPPEGVPATTEEGDALLDRLIDEHKVHYWLFAVRKTALQKSREVQAREAEEARRTRERLDAIPMEEDDADEEHVQNVNVETEAHQAPPPPQDDADGSASLPPFEANQAPAPEKGKSAKPSKKPRK